MFRFVTLLFVLALINSTNGDRNFYSTNTEDLDAINSLVGIIVILAWFLCSVASSGCSSVGGYMYSKHREENRQLAGSEMVSITESILSSSDCIL
ncbi:hypothetical protein M3Y98_01215300 [Aphelenchoides besseyi]|nr:hypothetical protein M3Y98_01215300 [Aphelenchoides besseyi]KAI6193280.1 hypothetical protein M3Y96_01001600 [Aphelenchoides besseyi]